VCSARRVRLPSEGLQLPEKTTKTTIVWIPDTGLEFLAHFRDPAAAKRLTGGF